MIVQFTIHLPDEASVKLSLPNPSTQEVLMAIDTDEVIAVSPGHKGTSVFMSSGQVFTVAHQYTDVFNMWIKTRRNG